MNERILLAESDHKLRGDFSRYLSGNHYKVSAASSSYETLLQIDIFLPDLVILDSALCPSGGPALCAEIRAQSTVPIILTSADATVSEKVRGLESGADDFVEKPCDIRELAARAKAVMRRDRAERTDHGRVLVYDKFELSLDRYELLLDGKKVDLTPKELQLLYFLASNPNKVFTRDQLLDEVWGYNYLGNTRTIDAHVRKVREKCADVSEEWAIRTVWGVGYKFEFNG